MSPPQTGCLSAPTGGRLLSPLQAPAVRRGELALPPAPPNKARIGHVPLGGPRLSDITAASPETVAAGLLGLKPSRSPPRRRPSARERRMAPSTSCRSRRPPIVVTARGGGR